MGQTINLVVTFTKEKNGFDKIKTEIFRLLNLNSSQPVKSLADFLLTL